MPQKYFVIMAYEHRSAAGASPGAPADWRIRVPLNAQYEYAFHSGFFRLNGLSSDDQKVIYMILEQYSGIFRPLYEKICDMCRNTAEVMSMYSKELAILDKNTVMLMMEEQQATIEELKQAVKALQGAAKNAKA